MLHCKSCMPHSADCLNDQTCYLIKWEETSCLICFWFCETVIILCTKGGRVNVKNSTVVFREIFNLFYMPPSQKPVNRTWIHVNWHSQQKWDRRSRRKIHLTRKVRASSNCRNDSGSDNLVISSITVWELLPQPSFYGASHTYLKSCSCITETPLLLPL